MFDRQRIVSVTRILLAVAVAAITTAGHAQVAEETLEEAQAADQDTVLPEFLFPNQKWTFYGQLVPSVLAFDDGQEARSIVVDNSNSPSRIGLYFDWEGRLLGPSRINIELGLGLRQSGGVSQNFTPEAWNGTENSLRFAEIISFTPIGNFYYGQGSMSTDGVAESDQSGTGIVATSSVADTAGSFFFREANGTLSDIRLSEVFRNLDGFRSLRLRYDTNEFSGFSGSVSVGTEVLFSQIDNDTFEFAGRYQGETEAFKIIGALGVAVVRDPADGNDVRTVGSASVLHKPSGVNFQASSGYTSAGGFYVYGKLGWRTNSEWLGQTFVSLDAYQSQSDASRNATARSFGISAVQNVERLNGEVYASLRRYSLTDKTPNTYKPATSIFGGLRWRF